MKKILTILLLMIYAAASFGFSVKQFYCCGQEKSVSFPPKQDLNEKYSQDNEKEGSCENQFHTLSHPVSAKIGNPAKYPADLHLLTFSAFCRSSLAAFYHKGTGKSTNTPSLNSGVPIYIFNCIYRI